LCLLKRIRRCHVSHIQLWVLLIVIWLAVINPTHVGGLKTARSPPINMEVVATPKKLEHRKMLKNMIGKHLESPPTMRNPLFVF